jgi:hypothetical protein
MYQGRKYNQLLTLYTQLGSARDAIKESTSLDLNLANLAC